MHFQITITHYPQPFIHIFDANMTGIITIYAVYIKSNSVICNLYHIIGIRFPGTYGYGAFAGFLAQPVLNRILHDWLNGKGPADRNSSPECPFLHAVYAEIEVFP